MDFISKVLNVIGTFIHACVAVILMWIALFGGSVQIHLNNPVEKIKELFK